MNNDLFAKIVEYPANSFKDIEQIYNRINQVIPLTKPVSISFDEWNLWYSWYAKSNVRSGIHTASYLAEFCKEGSSSGVSIGCYFQPVNEGAIEVYPDSATLTAAGQVFELYKEHHNNTLVQVKGVSPAISVLSSLNPEKTQLFITVVNLSPEKEKTIIINLKGIKNATLAGEKLFLGQNYDPGSKFLTRDLPVKMKNNKLEFILNKHSIGNIILGCSKNRITDERISGPK
jgi:alpha-L-arabinofuranosidase